jgi:hypothetical protein
MSQAHPTDEQLSASLDGHDDGATAHALACETCQARLAELRAVMALVAAVPPVDEVARERALAAALDTPMAPDIGLTPINQSRLRGGRAGLWLAAAAAVVLVLLAVPLLTRNDGDNQVAGRDATETADKSGPGAGGLSTAVVRDGGDLGDFSDPSKLRDALAPALDEAPTVSGAAAGGTSDAASPTTTTTSPRVNSPAALSGSAAGPVCADVVARDYGGGLGPLVYMASVRWNRTPAVVLAYQVAGASGGLDHRVYVLATNGCALLNVFSV